MRRRPELPQDLGLTWRALTLDDATKLSELIRTIEEADASPFRTSEAETAELLASDLDRIGTDSVVAISKHGTFLAYGLLHPDRDDASAVSLYLDGGVHPSVRTVGIGHAIVDWLTARSHEILAGSNSELPGRVSAQLQENAQDSWQPYEDNGFRVSRYFKGLRRDVSEPMEDVNLAGNLRLVPFTDDLRTAVRDAHDDAFGDHWSETAAGGEELEQTLDAIEMAWSFVVIDEGSVLDRTDTADPNTDGMLPEAGTATSNPTSEEPDLTENDSNLANSSESDLAQFGADKRTTDADHGDAGAELGAAPRVAGYVLVSKNELEWEVDGYSSGYVEMLGVRKSNRGQRIAIALLNQVARAIQSSGVQFVELDVDSEAPDGGTGLYTYLGYRITRGSRLYTLEY